MDAADGGLGELAPRLEALSRMFREPGGAMALQAAAYGRRTSTTLALSASASTVLWEEFSPVGASPVAVWARHLAMVIWLNPQRWTRLLAGSHNA